ncbi:hypothetical protein AHF37_11084 [Paragonimus kellicotti]|nr:hypothetical protein AHF37_12177 [Paragonimus kellicotti]KAF6770655.1 hypothetical protein AHF37_11084 [Paragonimus kellicotti]
MRMCLPIDNNLLRQRMNFQAYFRLVGPLKPTVTKKQHLRNSPELRVVQPRAWSVRWSRMNRSQMNRHQPCRLWSVRLHRRL